jgi:predicted PP-loop superfamily ATPase
MQVNPTNRFHILLPKRLLRSHAQFLEQMTPEIEIVEIKYQSPILNEIVKRNQMKETRAQIPRFLDIESAKLLI